jgi:hypothetical protein
VHTGSSVFQSPARTAAPSARWSYELTQCRARPSFGRGLPGSIDTDLGSAPHRAEGGLSEHRSTRPSRIKERVADLDLVGGLYHQLSPALQTLALNAEGILYYAHSVIKVSVLPKLHGYDARYFRAAQAVGVTSATRLNGKSAKPGRRRPLDGWIIEGLSATPRVLAFYASTEIDETQRKRSIHCRRGQNRFRAQTGCPFSPSL